MRLLLAVFLAVTVIATSTIPVIAVAKNNGITIVATIASIVPDIRQLVCENDVVTSITPPGIDPHEYELTPSDIETLRKADIIVSTAHTPFEKNIRELVEKGEIKALLLEIPYIRGIQILLNPATHQPNYHMPIYDPYNYKIFLKELERLMENKNPKCMREYRYNLGRIIDSIDKIISGTPRLKATALAATPLAQYAVSWLGINIKYLIIEEHGMPASPQKIMEITRAASKGEIDIIVLVNGAPKQVNDKAKEIAEKNHVPYIIVPSPLEQKSIVEKLSYIADQLRGINTTGLMVTGEEGSYFFYVTVALIIALFGVLLGILRREKV